MNSLYASLSIILAEIILLLLMVCGTLIFLKLRAQRHDKKALAQLTEKLQSSKEERLNSIAIKLKESSNLEGEALNTTAQEIFQKEIEFYIATMNTYAKRDATALAGLDQKISALSNTYFKSAAINTTSSDNSTSEALTKLQSELATALKVNERIEQELADSKKEMRETVAEFISAFSGGRAAAEEKIAQRLNAPTQAEESANAPGEDAATETPAVDTGSTITPDEAKSSSDEVVTPEIATKTPTSKETADSQAVKNTTEVDENNPFLNIDEVGATEAGSATTESEVDNTEELTELDIDLGLDTATTTKSKTDELAADDIDALLTASTNNEAKAAIDTPEKASDDDFNPDDIDALLAASSDDKPAVETPGAEKTATDKDIDTDDIDALLAATTADEPTAPKTEETPDIGADDIDAILEDIDLSAASALPSEKKEVEKVG